MKERITLVADILMGAAHADAKLEGQEKTTIRRLLREVLQAAALPLDVDFRLDEFDPAAFDLGEAGAAFAGDSAEQKRHLLQLVAAVHAADEEHDFLEDEYLRRVANAIGFPENGYADLVAEVVEETDLGAAADVLRPR